MSLITSAQAGPWSTGATWTGGVAPGDGDQAVINHAVTDDAGGTVGLSLCTSPNIRSVNSATGGGSVGGSLAAGTYRIRFSWVGSNGETGAGPSSTNVTVSSGNIPRATLPALPSGVTSANLYITEAGGSIGTERLYCTGITGTTVDLVSGSWGNTYDGSSDATGGSTAYADATGLPAESQAILVNSAGSLTLAAGVTRVARGDVQLGNTTFTLEAGSALEFDSSQSPDAAAIYEFRFGTAAAQTSTRLVTNGTQASRCEIRSNASGAPARFMGTVQAAGQTGQCLVDWEWTKFLRLGNTSYSGAVLTNSSAYVQQIVDCQFDTCGRIEIPNGTIATGGWSIRRGTWLNSNAATGGTSLQVECFAAIVTTSPDTGVDRVIEDCVFDEMANLPTFGTTITGCYFDNGYFTQSSGSTPSAELSEFFIRFDPRRSSHATGLHSPSDGYFYFDSTGAEGAITNPHGFQAGYDGQTWTGNVFEHNGDDGNGDCIYTFNVAGTFNVSNNLVLPEPGGKTSGTLTLQFNNTHASCVLNLYHNTICNSTGTTVICEGGTQPVGTLTNLKSNLYWRPQSPPTDNAQSGYKVALANGNYSGISNDILPPANATHNAILNGRAVRSSDGTTPITKSYNYPHTTDPGGNDIDLGTGDHSDLFVDPTRNFTTWSETVLGNTGTDAEIIAAGLAALKAANDPDHVDYNALATIAGLRTWVLAGWAPTDATLQDAGHDGVTIGAVEGVFDGGETFQAAWARGSNVLIGGSVL